MKMKDYMFQKSYDAKIKLANEFIDRMAWEDNDDIPSWCWKIYEDYWEDLDGKSNTKN